MVQTPRNDTSLTTTKKVRLKPFDRGFSTSKDVLLKPIAAGIHMRCQKKNVHFINCMTFRATSSGRISFMHAWVLILQTPE